MSTPSGSGGVRKVNRITVIITEVFRTCVLRKINFIHLYCSPQLRCCFLSESWTGVARWKFKDHADTVASGDTQALVKNGRAIAGCLGGEEWPL